MVSLLPICKLLQSLWETLACHHWTSWVTEFCNMSHFLALRTHKKLTREKTALPDFQHHLRTTAVKNWRDPVPAEVQYHDQRPYPLGRSKETFQRNYHHWTWSCWEVPSKKTYAEQDYYDMKSHYSTVEKWCHCCLIWV